MGREPLAALVTMMWFAPVACGGSTATSAAGSGGDAGASGRGGATESGGSGGTNGGSGHATATGGSGGRALPVDAGLPDLLSTADANCRTHPVADDCVSCCDSNHPNAYLVQAEPTRQCVCDAPGLCASPCARTYCVSQPVTTTGDPCHPCIFGTLGITGQCFGVAVKACGADAECRAYVDCRANCVR